jgi:hypothetical protein
MTFMRPIKEIGFLTSSLDAGGADLEFGGS